MTPPGGRASISLNPGIGPLPGQTRTPQTATAIAGRQIHLKGGMVTPAAQLVSGGIVGFARNSRTTVCAHGDCGVTKWPMPGMMRVVELGRVLATYVAQIGEVLPSKVPFITSVGMLLVVTSLMEAAALGTSHTAQSSGPNGSCGDCESTVAG